MFPDGPTAEQLLAENVQLRARLEEAEEALRAIRAGEVDALVVDGQGGAQIFTLQGVDAESNRFRGELLAQVSDALIVVDDDQRLTYLNAAAEHQYGVTAAEVVGLPVCRMFQPRWLDPADEVRAAAALRETGRWRGALVHVLPGGGSIHVEASVSRLDEASGAGPGQLAVIRDITQEHALRVMAQQRAELVRQSEVRLKRVLDQLFVMVGVIDLEGRLLECNSVPLVRAAIGPADVIGKPLWECHWWLHDATVAQQLRAGIRRATLGETVRFDASSRFAGGQLLTVDVQLAPLRDDTGRVTNVIVSGVDVEARVAALRELELSEARAVEAARRLDTLHRMLEATLEAAPVGIALADAGGEQLRFNQAGADLLGTASRSLEAQSLRGWKHAPDGGAALPLPPQQWPLPRALAQRRTVTGLIEIAPMNGGARRTVLMSAAPVLDAAGGVIASVLVLVDVTKRIEAEGALRRADRQKDEFLATLAHELRNPLAPIRTAAELIRRRDPADPVVQRARLIIERQVLHLTRLVDDLLDVSRITLGTIQLRQEPLDLCAVATSAVDSVMATLDAAGLRLELELPASSVAVHGDPTRLAQCIVNLLNNAVKFTPRGGHVRLRVAGAEATAVIEVSDDGIGIEPANLERIFELFVQEQPSGFGGNTGLGIGLALTRKLVVLHGGTVCARSQGRGDGSTFRIELPVAAAGCDAIRAATQPAGDAAGARVLIVDDNRDAADTLAEMLAMSGFSTAAEYTGATALDSLQRSPAHAVLLDIGLPDIDGYEVCGRIRGAALPRQPIVIALTGWAQDKDRDRATAAGFDGHVTKPAEPERVIALLQSLLAARR